MQGEEIITGGEIISYLITLYAVVPAVVITVLYNFLTSIEIEAARYSNENIKKSDPSIALNKFNFMSSKYFHLTMSYYLIMLFSTLIYKAFVSSVTDNGNIFLVFVLSTASSIGYAIWYIFADVKPGIPFESLYKFAWVLVVIFAIIPAVSIIFYSFTGTKTQHNLNFGWIGVSVLHLMIWWLGFPFKYRPLTNLKLLMDFSRN